jgi:drug/metabolite transporter (DMT)-like permease
MGSLALLWGSGFLLVKIALEGLNPIQIVFGRLLIAAMVMLALTGVRRERLPRKLQVWVHLGVMALIANIFPYILVAWAEQRITSSLSAVLNGTTPLFTLVIALSIGIDRPKRNRLIGLFLGFVGVLVLATPWEARSSSGSLLGMGAALLASAGYAASYIYARMFLTRYEISSLVLSTGQMVAGVLLLSVAVPVIGRQPMIFAPNVVAALVLLGVLGTGAAYVLNYQLIADEGATAASTVTYLLPVVAAVLGTTVLAERVTWRIVVGSSMILAGVALSDGTSSKADQCEPWSQARLPNHRQALSETDPYHRQN